MRMYIIRQIKMYEALQEGMSESDGQAVLCITIQNATGADENDLRNVKNYSRKCTVDVLAADCDSIFLRNIRLDGRDELSIYTGTADRAGHNVRDSRECTDNGYIAAGRAFLCRRAAGRWDTNRTIMIPPRQITFPPFRAVTQEPITMYYL